MKTWIFATALFFLAGGWLVTHPSTLSGEATERLFFGMWKTRDLAIAACLTWIATAALLARQSRAALLRFSAANAAFACTWVALEIFGVSGLVDYGRLLRPTPEAKLGSRRVPHADVAGDGLEDLAAAWGAEATPIAFHFKTDRYGFRNHEDRAAADLYCLGDSFLVAGLVPFQDTVTHRLETALDRPAMSLALNGLAPQEECDLFRDLEFEAKGKLIVQFLFEGNDLSDSAAIGASAHDGRSLRDRTLINNVILKLQAWTQPVDEFLEPRSGRIDDERYLFRWTRSAFEGFEGEIDDIQASLLIFREQVVRAGGNFAVVMIPSKLRVLGPLCEFPERSPLHHWQQHCSPLPDAIAAFCDSNQIDYLDLTPALSAAAKSGEVPWFPGDTHWNATGHRIAAESLLGWDVVRDWSATEEAQ